MQGNRVEPVYGVMFTQAEQLQWDLQNAVDAILGRGNNNCFDMQIPSNIFAGATNDAVRGEWTHDLERRPDYWFNNAGTPTYRQNSELFAHYFGASMVRNQAILDNMDEYFPTAAPNAREIMEQIKATIQGG